MAYTDFVFFDESSAGNYSTVFRNMLDQGELVLHVELLSGSAVDIDIECQVDIESDDWEPLFAVDLSHIDAVTKITLPGIYSIGMNGIRKLRLKNNGTAGSVKVYGPLVDR